MASVVAVLVTTRDAASGETTGDDATTARFDIQSASLADILLESPGYFHPAATPNTVSALDWSNAADYNGRTVDADRIDRLGLLDSDDPNPFMMDYAKFQNLRRAGFYANATNGFVDYQEAAKTLGTADAGLDFHIRAYPTLDTVADLLNPPASKDTNLRVTYVGDIEVQTTSTSVSGDLTDGLTMSNPTCSLDASNPQVYLISVTVHNGGDDVAAPTQFTAVTTVDIGANNQVQLQNTNGFLVPSGSDVVLSVEVPAISGRDCVGGSAIFDLYDPVHGKLTSRTTSAFTSPGTASPAAVGLRIDTGKQNYRPSDVVTLNYDGNGLKNNDDLLIRICPGTTECSTSSVATMKHGTSNNPPTINAGQAFNAESNSNSRVLTIAANSLAVGSYTAFLYDCESDSCTDSEGTADNLWVSERILVTAAAVGGYVPENTVVLSDPIYSAPAGGPEQEVLYLELLIQKFCPTWFDSDEDYVDDSNPATSPNNSPLSGVDWDDRCSSFKPGPLASQPGDVFPDSKKVMNEDLPARLVCQVAAGCPGGAYDPSQTALFGEPRYDIANVLVIGSSVDHSAMTSQSAKGTIEDWVHGGGTIVVFGSEEGNVQWLEPLFHSAIAGNGGAISTPDQGHPMLHTPNELNNPGENYDAHDTAWRFNGQTAKAQNDPNTAVFSNVIVIGDQTTGDPLLALSNKGSFGAGSIVITAYMPYDLYEDDSFANSCPATGLVTSPCPTSADCGTLTVGQCEGMKFMHNMLMQGYADLFLDYGPDIPENTNVQPSIRLAQIRHPQFILPVELTLIVYVF